MSNNSNDVRRALSRTTSMLDVFQEHLVLPGRAFKIGDAANATWFLAQTINTAAQNALSSVKDQTAAKILPSINGAIGTAIDAGTFYAKWYETKKQQDAFVEIVLLHKFS